MTSSWILMTVQDKTKQSKQKSFVYKCKFLIVILLILLKMKELLDKITGVVELGVVRVNDLL